MGGMSGKNSAELKPRGDKDNTYDGEINVKGSDFTKIVSLEVAFTLRSFLRKKARRVILCFSIQNDQGKKCETTAFEPGKSGHGFLYVTLQCLP